MGGSLVASVAVRAAPEQIICVPPPLSSVRKHGVNIRSGCLRNWAVVTLRHARTAGMRTSRCLAKSLSGRAELADPSCSGMHVIVF